MGGGRKPRTATGAAWRIANDLCQFGTLLAGLLLIALGIGGFAEYLGYVQEMSALGHEIAAVGLAFLVTICSGAWLVVVAPKRIFRMARLQATLKRRLALVELARHGRARPQLKPQSQTDLVADWPGPVRPDGQRAPPSL